MAEDERDVPELAEQIVRADGKQQRRQEPPLPDGWWARLVERDRRARATSHPHATGGFLNILYPWRLYILVVAALMLVALLLISLLDIYGRPPAARALAHPGQSPVRTDRRRFSCASRARAHQEARR